MADDQLPKLRRFALIIGVLLITYVLAGIAIEAVELFETQGVRWRILRPEFVPIGLALASGYAIFQYWLHAVALRKSPMRARRELLTEMSVTRTVPTGTITLCSESKEPADLVPFQQRVESLFPHFLGAGPRSRIAEKPKSDERGVQFGRYSLTVTVSRAVQLGSRVQDLDYTLRIWVNVVALALYSGFLVKDRLLNLPGMLLIWLP